MLAALQAAHRRGGRRPAGPGGGDRCQRQGFLRRARPQGNEGEPRAGLLPGAVCALLTADAGDPQAGGACDRARAGPGHGSGLPAGGAVRSGGGQRGRELWRERHRRGTVLRHAGCGPVAQHPAQAGDGDAAHGRLHFCRRGLCARTRQPGGGARCTGRRGGHPGGPHSGQTTRGHRHGQGAVLPPAGNRHRSRPTSSPARPWPATWRTPWRKRACRPSSTNARRTGAPDLSTQPFFRMAIHFHRCPETHRRLRPLADGLHATHGADRAGRAGGVHRTGLGHHLAAAPRAWACRRRSPRCCSAAVSSTA